MTALMERRNFIAAAGLAGILATGSPPPVHAGQAIRWRLLSRLPRTMEIAHAALQFFTRTIKEISEGKFEIFIQSSDEAQSGGVFDSVQRGSVECGHTSANYYLAKDETFALDSGIPFGLNARQSMAWLRHGNGLNLLREFYREQGIVNFPMGNTGAQMGGWYRRLPRSPADFKGLRIRIAGLGTRILERMGATPTYLSSTETFLALQRGNIDAAEWSAPHDDLRLGLHDHCKYYGYPGWWRGSGQFSLFVNRRAYDALNTDNQAIVAAAAAATHLEILAQYDTRNPLALEQLVATGTQLVALPRAVLDAAYKHAQALYAELAVKNPGWRKIHESQAAFLKDQAWDHAEMSFASYMHEQQLKSLKEQMQEQKREQARKKSAPAGRR